MFARKHLLRWLTTPYRQPVRFPNSERVFIRTGIGYRLRLLHHLVELYMLAATGKQVDHSNQHGGYRLHVRSHCAPRPLRPVMDIRRICPPALLYINRIPNN